MSSGEGDDEATRENNLLSFYEELFRDRFTERDAEFMRTLQQPRPPPPCVENWYTRPKRTFDYTARQDTTQNVTFIWWTNVLLDLIWYFEGFWTRTYG